MIFYIIASPVAVGGIREPAATEYGSNVQVFKLGRFGS